MTLKALHYLGGARLVIGHSVVELLAPLTDTYPALAALRGAAACLDQLYIPTRSPNGLPGGVPAEVFSNERATEAIDQATRFIERAAELIRVTLAPLVRGRSTTGRDAHCRQIALDTRAGERSTLARLLYRRRAAQPGGRRLGRGLPGRHGDPIREGLCELTQCSPDRAGVRSTGRHVSIIGAGGRGAAMEKRAGVLVGLPINRV